MLKLQITSKKGSFKEFLEAYNSVSLNQDNNGRLYDRITYTIYVDPATYETTIVFKPVEGIEEISMQDFKIVTDLISRSEV